MDINALASGTSGSSPSVPASARSAKKASDSLGLNKALNQGALVSGLLPSTSSASSGSGASLGHDIYLAVGMQTQGMMSRGLTGIQIANISLGIDMSQSSKESPDAAAETDGAASGESPSADAATGDAKAPPPVDEAGHAARVLDGMLKEDAASSSRIYVRPELSNPGLGGLLNSLG